jgi:hypothetical protein
MLVRSRKGEGITQPHGMEKWTFYALFRHFMALSESSSPAAVSRNLMNGKIGHFTHFFGIL